ncbi:F11 receptor, tandem duplicate 1 [Tachysurus ichikawai]
MFFVFVLLCSQAAGLHAFTASTTTPNVAVKENNGADLKCDFSADFGATPRVEWKFRNVKGSQSFIYFDGKITDKFKGYMTQYPGGLTIQKATRQDTGDYFCEVSGSTGYAEVMVKLTVLGKLLFL